MQMDQCCQEEAGQGGITAAETPLLGRLHLVPPPPLPDHCTLLLTEQAKDRDRPMMQNYIKEGFLYEIDHIQLPPRTPVQLRSNIRVAMVCEKTEMTVSVRFPSMESLRAFFNYSRRETHPALDEKFVMGTARAVKVLYRLVPPEIFSKESCLQSFWLIRSSVAELCKDVNVARTTEKGICLSDQLKGNGKVRWGIRRQVKYLGRRKESNGKGFNSFIPDNSSSSFLNGVEMSQMENGDDDDEKKEDSDDGEEKEEDMDEEGKREEEEEESGDDQEDDVVEEKMKETNRNFKRKRYSFRNIGVKKTKEENKSVTGKLNQKHRKKNQLKKNKSKSRYKEALVLRDPKDRWSSKRVEARRNIGDTGLLDHLLKHMAGRLAPGGAERFRRRYNPDGAIEYWLESADLVNIRREAGVSDPYWVPPPGWKPGDSPTQDPICARELKLLKDDIFLIKRNVELMATKMHLQEEVGKLRREFDEIVAKKRHEESQALVKRASSHCCTSQKLDQLVATSNFDFDSPPVSVEKCKEQLMVFSDFVKKMVVLNAQLSVLVFCHYCVFSLSILL